VFVRAGSRVRLSGVAGVGARGARSARGGGRTRGVMEARRCRRCRCRRRRRSRAHFVRAALGGIKTFNSSPNFRESKLERLSQPSFYNLD
jgi:hypothetical protein